MEENCLPFQVHFLYKSRRGFDGLWKQSVDIPVMHLTFGEYRNCKPEDAWQTKNGYVYFTPNSSKEWNSWDSLTGSFNHFSLSSNWKSKSFKFVVPRLNHKGEIKQIIAFDGSHVLKCDPKNGHTLSFFEYPFRCNTKKGNIFSSFRCPFLCDVFHDVNCPLVIGNLLYVLEDGRVRCFDLETNIEKQLSIDFFSTLWIDIIFLSPNFYLLEEKRENIFILSEEGKFIIKHHRNGTSLRLPNEEKESKNLYFENSFLRSLNKRKFGVFRNRLFIRLSGEQDWRMFDKKGSSKIYIEKATIFNNVLVFYDVQKYKNYLFY